MPCHILIIEDEQLIAELLADNLEQENYRVSIARDGAEGEKMWLEAAPNLIVLDVMLPYQDGYSLCRKMRQQGDSTPVLFLSAKSDTQARVQGLKAGGDDYLAKPFDLEEFLLRVNNMYKRQYWGVAERDDSYSFADYRIDFRSYEVARADATTPLSEKEVQLLRLFCQHPHEVIERDRILDVVWGDDVFPSSRTVDNLVMRLRKIFSDDANEARFFRTVWGVGYKFTP